MVRRTVVAVTAGVVVVVAAGTAIAVIAGRGAGSPLAAGPSTTDGPTTTTEGSSPTTAPATPAASSASTPVGAGSTTRPATRSAGVTTSATTSAVPGPPGISTPPLATTDVSVTYAGWDRPTEQVQVDAFMPLLENGGTCMLTMADATGVHQRTATARASADATTTICDQLTINSTTMAAGTWSATVTYSSPTHHGRSAASQVVVTR